MTEEQQNKLLPLLLAIAMDGDRAHDKAYLQHRVKEFLRTIPPEDIAKAASTPLEF